MEINKNEYGKGMDQTPIMLEWKYPVINMKPKQ
jgi:hypothetical protein